MKTSSQVELKGGTESTLRIRLSLCRRRLSVAGACAVGGTSHRVPLRVRYSRSESGTGLGPQGRASSGEKVGNGVKAPVWASGYC